MPLWIHCAAIRASKEASPPQDLPHFPRNHTRGSTHYLSKRPEVSSHDEKSRKAETRVSLGTPGVTISKRLCGIPFMARPPVVSGGRPSFRCVPFGFARASLVVSTYSPMIVRKIFRRCDARRCSNRKTPCQVPSCMRPSATGMVSLLRVSTMRICDGISSAPSESCSK